VVREEAIGGALRQAVYVKVAGALEPPSYTCTLSAAQQVAGGITTYSGVDAADPVEADAVSVNSTAGTAVASPSVTTTGPDALLVQLTGINAEGKLKPPAGMTERWEAASRNKSQPRDALASSADARRPVAGPSGSVPGTASKRGRSIVVLLALRPAL
jgi:hypothetical protein